MKQRQWTICISIIIFISILELGVFSSEGGTITTFSDSTSEKTISLPSGGGIDESASFEIPKKANITDASFDVSTNYSGFGNYPVKPRVDVGGDGDFEWEFTGVGYGEYGRQNVFLDDRPMLPVVFEQNDTFKNDVKFLLPKNASISSATMKVRGGGAGKVLLVSDGANSYGVKLIDSALTNIGNQVTMCKESNLPSNWNDPKVFKAIFWIGAVSSSNGPSNTLLKSFTNYVKGGGNVFMCGAWIDYTGSYSGTDEVPFFEWTLHHTWGNRWGGGGSGIGTTNKYTHQSNTSHPVFNTPNTLPGYWNNLYTGTFWHSPSGTINNGSIIGKVDTTTSNPRYSAIIAWDGPAYSASYGRTLMVRQPIARSWFNITQGDVLTNFTENVASWFLGMGKAENVTINIGDNGGTPEFDHSGELNESMTVPDFTSELSNLISISPVIFTDDYGTQFVEILVNVTNDVEGMVLLSDLNIEYNMTSSAFLNPHNGNLINELNELVPETGEGNITIPLKIHAESAGNIRLHNILIDFFVPELTNDRLLLLNGHGVENICYADYENYLFMVNITSRSGVSDVNNVTLTLDAGGEQISLFWNETDKTFSELYDPKNLVELEVSECQNITITPERWGLIFSVRFSWEYFNETLEQCAVQTTNDSGSVVFNYFEDVYRVENDLDIIGSLSVVANDQGTLVDDGVSNWVHANEIITWSNLTAVYEGTTSIYPANKNFNITITDDDTGLWVNNSSSGNSFNIITISDSSSDYTDVHDIDITDIPGYGEDVSNWVFTIKTDNDGPLAPPGLVCHADSPTDPETNADDDTTIYVVWTSADDQSGSGVLEYALEFNDNQPTIIRSSGSAVVGTEGLAIFYVRARDNVGNWGLINSASIFIDLTELSFSHPEPGSESWQTSKTVPCGITIKDLGGSGVDASTIQYRFVDSGTIEQGIWHSYNSALSGTTVECIQNITFSTDGLDKKVQWRARDFAGNGFKNSPVYTHKIDSNPVSFESFSFDFNKWHNTLSPEIAFYVNDTNPSGGVSSGLDTSSLSYSYSTSGGSDYSQWISIIGTGTEDSVRGNIEVSLIEGDQNYIKFKGNDIAGNELETDDHQIMVDVTTPEFTSPWPDTQFWSNSTRVKCDIALSDYASKIDIQTLRYSISNDASKHYSNWRMVNTKHLLDTEYFQVTVSCNESFIEGDMNRIRWLVSDTAGNSIISDDYPVYIDLTNCSFHAPTPEPSSWINETSVYCSIIINDSLGSGVNLNTIEYSTSIGAKYSWDSWKNTNLELIDKTGKPYNQTAIGPTSIQARVLINKLTEGTLNFIRWRALDLAGNEYSFGGPYTIKSDLTPITFHNPQPKPGVIQIDYEHSCRITIKDLTGSGVNPGSIEYRYLTSTATEYSNWSNHGVSYERNVDSYTFLVYLSLSPGTSNYIQWRASDFAGNGPISSEPYKIPINSPPLPIITYPHADGDYYEKENITFNAQKSSDSDIADRLTVYWVSNLTGPLGYFDYFKAILSPGDHNITLFVTDSYHNVSVSVNITVKRPDLDGDGTPDVYDPDLDGDGCLNYEDAFPHDKTEWLDYDQDGLGNNADKDDDNDRYLDTDDDYPLDATRWEREEVESQSSGFFLIVIALIIIIVVILSGALFYGYRKKKGARSEHNKSPPGTASASIPGQTTNLPQVHSTLSANQQQLGIQQTVPMQTFIPMLPPNVPAIPPPTTPLPMALALPSQIIPQQAVPLNQTYSTQPPKKPHIQPVQPKAKTTLDSK